MIFGMTTFTFVHVVLSLIGIGSGLIVLYGLLVSGKMPTWTAIFLASTVATSVTGFFFAFDHLLPSHVTGIISLVVLAVALVALYVRRLAGAWRWIYVASAVIALYLNVFVLVAQLFQKVASLKTLAPTQAEPPFVVAQGVVLVAFLVLGIAAARKFHPTAR
jgi:hypothetical protein